MCGHLSSPPLEVQIEESTCQCPLDKGSASDSRNIDRARRIDLKSMWWEWDYLRSARLRIRYWVGMEIDLVKDVIDRFENNSIHAHKNDDFIEG